MFSLTLKSFHAMFTLLRTPFFPHLFFSSNYLIEIQDAVVKSSLEILGKTFWLVQVEDLEVA